MSDGVFPSAQNARYASRNNLLLFREIRDIEEEIIIASDAGKFSVNVSSTTMTLYPDDTSWIHTHIITDDPVSIDYYDVWKGNTIDNVKYEQMKIVINHFKNLGYSIVRRLNQETNTTFYWEIQW